jgi:hypothetical protein
MLTTPGDPLSLDGLSEGQRRRWRGLEVTMHDTATGASQEYRPLLWTARIMGTLIALFALMMVFAYAVNPQGSGTATTRETVMLAFFPIGMSVGYLVAWKWPLIGGIVSIVSVAVFLIMIREAAMLGIVSFLAIPGALFIIHGVLARQSAPVVAVDEERASPHPGP